MSGLTGKPHYDYYSVCREPVQGLDNIVGFGLAYMTF